MNPSIRPATVAPVSRARGRAQTPWSPTHTYSDVVSGSLRRLCDALGFEPAQRDAAVALTSMMMVPWIDRMIGDSPMGPSDITDEHFPIEFSTAFENGEPEVRVLFEAQADHADPAQLWEAAWEVCELLEQGDHVSLDRLRQVADLFEPSSPTSRYAMWHCVCFSPSGPPKFKVYLNPLAHGATKGPEIIRETLQRLGFSAAIQDVFADDANGELRFLSLDLSSREDARVKVYRVHYDATQDEVSSWLRCVPCYDEATVQNFWDTIAPTTTRFSQLPVSTYVSLDSRSERPSTATIHFPVRSYADNDLEVYRRVRRLLGPTPDRALYEQALACYARRPLTDGVGMQSYVALRIHPGAHQHTTVYLSPEAYEVQQAESAPTLMS